MRPFLTAASALALLLASAAPTALASPSALRIDLEGVLPADATVPVNVTLVIQDFMCSEPRAFTVHLASNATESVKAAFALSSLTFTTGSHAYFADEYRQTQTVNLTVRAIQSGQVELTASFPAHETGPCLAPDGFQPSATTVLVAVQAPAGPPPPTTPPPTTPESNASAETNTTEPTPPSSTARPPPRPDEGQMTCAPDGGCGFIGEYDAPQESSNDTPGLALVGALAAAAVAALALRRKK